MAFDFKNAFNKYFAEPGNKLNKAVNNVVGKEIFGEIKPIEEARQFAPYNTFPNYTVPEPNEWTSQDGAEKIFTLNGSKIYVSKNLDTCLKYRPMFKEAATYYSNRFKFKYECCVDDFDSLLNYFFDMYNEGLSAMLNRAYSLLLPFGVFSVNLNDFAKKHTSNYHKAISSYNTMAGIEESRNEAAQSLGNNIGNSVRLQGGGFGVKGAAKGIATAELFNAGMGLVGKYLTNQTKMSAEEKQKVYEAFKPDVFFREVYCDYNDVFYTLVQTLAENKVLPRTTIMITSGTKTMIDNLSNPMFPKDKICPVIADIISHNPFIPKVYDILKEKVGVTEEVKQITEYFVFN